MNWKLTYATQEQCAGQEFHTVAALEAAGFAQLPAAVPGNFELDLMRTGKLPDLFFSDNVWTAQKYEATHVWYSTRVNIDKPTEYLLFEGIDTFAEIYVNGWLSATSGNMFLPCKAKEGLHLGENEIVVHIRPAMLEARKHVSPAACNAMEYNYAALYQRKAAHMYGWDIMPRIISAGLWKPVRICVEALDCIHEFYVVTHRIDFSEKRAYARIYVSADLSGDFVQDYSVRVEGRCGESSFCKEMTLWHNTYAFPFEIDNCRLWYPRNAGAPALYDAAVTLLRKGRICDAKSFKLGVRTVQLERADDTQGENGEFVFRINGKKIFCLGTNWVPLDAFHSQDPARLPQALALLTDSGCNMVRCWGGNVYESDEFFDYCDAHGIMVWQDFAMGCAVYPQDEAFAAKLEQEAVYQIKRLRNHAALVLWAGDNEGDQVYYDGIGLRRDPNRNRLTRETLRRAVELHDYSRPYLPSSPFFSEAVFRREAELPEMHLWGPRDYFKGDFYKNTFCHFASETGYHGFPSVPSLKRFLAQPEKIFEENGAPTQEYLAHAASMEPSPDAPYAFRIRLAYNQVITLFGSAESELADFVRQSQISQAEAKKYFIEKFRIAKWKRSGIPWWNLLDGWPQISDAVVDYYFSKKLAYYYIRRSQAPVCLMFDEPEGSTLRLVGVNDLSEAVRLHYKVTRVSDTPEQVLSGAVRLSPVSAATIDTLVITPKEQAFYLIEWSGDVNGRNHYYTNLLQINYHSYLSALSQCGMDEFDF